MKSVLAFFKTQIVTGLDRFIGRLVAIFMVGCFGSLMLVFTSSTGLTQDKSRVPQMTIYQAMLDGNKERGWVSFRNFGGKQLIYFTALQTLHCRLKEIRYSVNSKELDKVFDLVKCNPQNPFALPPNSQIKDTMISFPKGTVKTLAVQVTWEDDRKSDIAVYEPCKDVGDQTCAWPLE